MRCDPWQQVHVIGIDDGGAAGLGPSELDLIGAADLLCGGHRHLDLFPDTIAERFPIDSDLASLYELLERSNGRRAVVLVSGDPCFYGLGPLLVDRLGRHRVTIHPHAGSVATAFARLGLGWQDARVISVHGRPIETAVPTALGATKIAILTDPEHTPGSVAEVLLGAGMEDCCAFVCERLGGAAEQIHELTLTGLRGRSFDPLNVLILLRDPLRGEVESPPAVFGRLDSAYGTIRGQITKAEVRAVTLARLEPWHALVAWDIGAGAGSMAIELAGLMRGGAVYAIERHPEQLQVLRENVRKLGAGRVRVVSGSAPEALNALPEPDAVFIGGGGAALEAILRRSAEGLRPGGRLIANFTLLESLSVWQRVATALDWPHDLVQISVARGAPLGEGTRLDPLGPVFVTRLVRPGGST